MSEYEEAQQEIEAIKRDRYTRSRMGVLVEQWRSSEIGRYVAKRAEQHQRQILKTLIADVDFDDPKQLYAMRMEYKMVECALRWLDEIVAEGHASFAELQQIEESERYTQ